MKISPGFYQTFKYNRCQNSNNMDKEKILRIAAIVFFSLTVLTALVMFIFFPPMKGIGYQTFLGTLKVQWLAYHKWFGAAFAVLAIVWFILGKKKKE